MSQQQQINMNVALKDTTPIKCEECENEKTCGLSDVMREVREATIAILSKTSIQDLIEREDTLSSKFDLN